MQRRSVDEEGVSNEEDVSIEVETELHLSRSRLMVVQEYVLIEFNSSQPGDWLKEKKASCDLDDELDDFEVDLFLEELYTDAGSAIGNGLLHVCAW